MKRALLWVDDTGDYGRGRIVAGAVVIFGVVLGGGVGWLVSGSASTGAFVGMWVAVAAGVGLGILAFIAGKRAHGDTTWQHLKRSWLFSGYGKEQRR
jgi:hypothetical protein